MISGLKLAQTGDTFLLSKSLASALETNKLINKLVEDSTRIESTEDLMEDDIDIENLLHANLGEVDLSDILNLNGIILKILTSLT